MHDDPEKSLTSTLEWRGAFTNDELNALHAEGFDHRLLQDDWLAQVERHSLGWVCVRQGGRLAGFVNVAWDGGVHAFLLDTVVAEPLRRQGIARAMVAEAVRQAAAQGCEWLHVDFDPHLRAFYFDACGFRPTDAGVIQLRSSETEGPSSDRGPPGPPHGFLRQGEDT